MRLFKKSIMLLMAYSFFFFASTTGSFASTILAASGSYNDVKNAVNSANSGDVISIPAGSFTWSSTLTITKNITLQGAGIDKTIISGTNSGENNFLIDYNPDSSTDLFRITGFTFNITQQQAIRLNNKTFPPAYRIRIDHNRFTNSNVPRAAIMNWGCRGVIDHNIFDNMYNPMGVGQGTSSSGLSDWANLPDLVFGAPHDNIYVEDNTFTNAKYWVFVVQDGDQGGRYVYRYNTINSNVDAWPLFDMHGGRGGLWGTMGGEVYGNQITCPNSYLISQRGGRATVHHNSVVGSSNINIYNNSGCPPEPHASRQLINNSYHFLNRNGLSGNLIGWINAGKYNQCGDVAKNETFWMDDSSCQAPNVCNNQSEGIGCGPLVNRPASCTTGTAYWATSQSCTNLAGMVGVNPSVPISGTLYKCTSTNTWTAYYTPLQYPHPLVQGSAASNSQNSGLSSPKNLRIDSVK